MDGSILPQLQLDFVSYYVLADRGNNLPAPSSAGLDQLLFQEATQLQRLVDLTESALILAPQIASSMVAFLATRIPKDGFWSLTKGSPGVRIEVLHRDPAYSLSRDYSLGDNSSYVAALREIAPKGAMARELVSMRLNDADLALAQAMVDLFKEDAGIEVVRALGSGKPMSSAWLASLVRDPNAIMTDGILKQIEKTSVLYKVAEAVGWLSPVVLKRATQAWLLTYRDAKIDSPEWQLDELHAFLIGLALGSEQPSLIPTFEVVFDALHDRIVLSQLSWKALETLEPFLPRLDWAHAWDTALRLRLAIVRAFVDRQIPETNFVSLSNRRETLRLLMKAADITEGGRRYAKAIQQALKQ
jgi:hypothetical protein